MSVDAVELARWLQARGDVIVIRKPARALVAYGALVAIAGPLAVALVELLVLLALGLESEVALAICWSLGVVVAAAAFVLGVALALTAPSRSAKSEVRLDVGERLLHRGTQVPELLGHPSEVRLWRKSKLLAFWSLGLAYDDGRVAVLLSRVHSAHAKPLVAVAERLAELLEIEARIPGAARAGLGAGDPRTQAALCYVPIDGVFLLASLYFLLRSDDPFVRFAARQSLLHFVISTALLLFSLGCLAVPIAALGDALPTVFSVVALALPLVVLALWRVGSYVYAAYQAQRGVAWVMPWLRPIVGRWLPPRP